MRELYIHQIFQERHKVQEHEAADGKRLNSARWAPPSQLTYLVRAPDKELDDSQINSIMTTDLLFESCINIGTKFAEGSGRCNLPKRKFRSRESEGKIESQSDHIKKRGSIVATFLFMPRFSNRVLTLLDLSNLIHHRPIFPTRKSNAL